MSKKPKQRMAQGAAGASGRRIFPLMSAKELGELADDIAVRGLGEPVVIWREDNDAPLPCSTAATGSLRSSCSAAKSSTPKRKRVRSTGITDTHRRRSQLSDFPEQVLRRPDSLCRFQEHPPAASGLPSRSATYWQAAEARSGEERPAIAAAVGVDHKTVGRRGARTKHVGKFPTSKSDPTPRGESNRAAREGAGGKDQEGRQGAARIAAARLRSSRRQTLMRRSPAMHQRPRATRRPVN